MPQISQKNKIKDLTDAIEECHISSSEIDLTKEIELDDIPDPKLLLRWPKPKKVVPTIFLHKTVDFAQHSKKLIMQGVNFYQPYLGTSYTRIICQTPKDHTAMVQYFDKNKLPCHTFGDYNEKKMKVVIRGLNKDIKLDELENALKAVGIPIIRMHKMHMKVFVKDKDVLVLAVVPYNDEGKKLLQLKKVFGHDVKLEPPLPKIRQCFRCQKWGHAQRYCHGQIACVKCAGAHYYTECQRDSGKETPTCANCGGDHTASYRECFFCPDSTEYKKNQKKKLNRPAAETQKRVLVTLENHEKLYRKIKNIPKHNEAKPF